MLFCHGTFYAAGSHGYGTGNNISLPGTNTLSLHRLWTVDWPFLLNGSEACDCVVVDLSGYRHKMQYTAELS